MHKLGTRGGGVTEGAEFLQNSSNLSPEMVCEMFFSSELLRTVRALVGSLASV